MQNTWFKKTECSQLEIKRFKVNLGTEAQQNIQIQDADVIQKFINRISEMSANGDMMKEISLDETIVLEFNCGSEKKLIEIYNGRFKTPSTGFNSSTADRAKEEIIYKDLNSLLQPTLGAKILKIKGLEISFKDFFITFKKNEPFTVQNTSISGQRDRFMVKDNSGVTQELSISSGQLPPQPAHFEVNKTKFTLLTYNTEDSQRLYPDYFQVIKSK